MDRNNRDWCLQCDGEDYNEDDWSEDDADDWLTHCELDREEDYR